MSDESGLEKRSPGGVAARGDDTIQDAGGLIRGTMAELERMLDSKAVVGEPMTFANATVVPLVSMGFGFGAGAGGGAGTSPKGERGQGGGGGGGGGGGVKPIAVLVIDESGVRLDPIPEPPSGLSKLGEAIAGAIDRRTGKTEKSD